MKMKRYCILFFLLVILHLQFGRLPYVNTAITKNGTDGSVLCLTVTANKLFIADNEHYASSLIQQTLENRFQNMLFSYDLIGYPKEIQITVYTNNLSRFLKKPAFVIHYDTHLKELSFL